MLRKGSDVRNRTAAGCRFTSAGSVLGNNAAVSDSVQTRGAGKRMLIGSCEAECARAPAASNRKSGDGLMFPVEIQMHERAEDALPGRMTAMRQWLDHQHFEPSTFRYTFTGSGIVFLVYFALATEAAAFAAEFSGRLIEVHAETASP